MWVWSNFKEDRGKVQKSFSAQIGEGLNRTLHSSTLKLKLYSMRVIGRKQERKEGAYFLS